MSRRGVMVQGHVIHDRHKVAYRARLEADVRMSVAHHGGADGERGGERTPARGGGRGQTDQPGGQDRRRRCVVRRQLPLRRRAGR